MQKSYPEFDTSTFNLVPVTLMVAGNFLSIFAFFCIVYIDVYFEMWYTIHIFRRKGEAYVSQINYH